MTTTPEPKTPEQIIGELQDELEYRVRTAVARWRAASRIGDPDAPSRAVQDEVTTGRAVIANKAAGLLAADGERSLLLVAQGPDERDQAERHAGHGEHPADDRENGIHGAKVTQSVSPQRPSSPECDRDHLGICHHWGEGLNARKILDGDASCPAGVAPQKPSPVASTPTVSDDSGHGGDDDRGGREDGPEDEGRSHQATVAVTPQRPSGCAECHRSEGHKMDCSLRAAPSLDRQKLIATAKAWLASPTATVDGGRGAVRQLLSVLAAALVVDEEKLAEVLASAANHRALSCGGTLGAGVSAESTSHLAHAATEWLRGG